MDCVSGGEEWSVLCSEAVLQPVGGAARADGGRGASRFLDERGAR